MDAETFLRCPVKTVSRRELPVVHFSQRIALFACHQLSKGIRSVTYRQRSSAHCARPFERWHRRPQLQLADATKPIMAPKAGSRNSISPSSPA